MINIINIKIYSHGTEAVGNNNKIDLIKGGSTAKTQ